MTIASFELTQRLDSLAILGIPPQFRGQTRPGRDAELALLKAFPSIALFCEKPVTTGPYEGIDETSKVKDMLAEQSQTGIIGVGYMLRYLKACEDIK